jgi:hypothetical protein
MARLSAALSNLALQILSVAREQSRVELERLVQLQLNGAPGAPDWQVFPLLPNITLPAPRV